MYMNLYILASALVASIIVLSSIVVYFKIIHKKDNGARPRLMNGDIPAGKICDKIQLCNNDEPKTWKKKSV